MKDFRNEIEYKGEKFPLIFNLNVMEEIQRKYGTIAKWGELTDGAGETDAKAVKYGIMCMINEALDMENEETGNNRPMLTEKQVGRMLTEVGINLASEKIKETVINSTTTEEKNE